MVRSLSSAAAPGVEGKLATLTSAYHYERELMRRYPKRYVEFSIDKPIDVAGFRVTPLEAVYYAIAVASVCLGWYFNIRYVQQYGHRASWPNYISLLWKNWAADSASQDYFFANLLIFPRASRPRCCTFHSSAA